MRRLPRSFIFWSSSIRQRKDIEPCRYALTMMSGVLGAAISEGAVDDPHEAAFGRRLFVSHCSRQFSARNDCEDFR